MTSHQRAQAHNSTLYRQQFRFMFWLCSKQNCLLCPYEFDFGDNYIITIVKTGLTTKKYVAVLSVLNLVSDFVKCNHLIASSSSFSDSSNLPPLLDRHSSSTLTSGMPHARFCVFDLHAMSSKTAFTRMET
jgi:hypothetical protein